MIPFVFISCQCTTTPTRVFSFERRQCSIFSDGGVQFTPTTLFSFKRRRCSTTPLYSPSFADLHNIRIESKSRYRVAINDHIYKKDDTLEGVVTDVDNDIKLLDAFGISVCESKLVIQRSSEIPSLYIQLSNGTMKQINSDKNISKDGIIQAIDSQETADYLGSFKEFHGRGNSSWLGAKKPYSIEFENDTSLFDMRKGKKYNLLSNGGDFGHKIALDILLSVNLNMLMLRYAKRQ